jgi:hypothetical protein
MSLIKSNNTGSINDDTNHIAEEESDSSINRYDGPEIPVINSEVFNKVSPYSIKNLSSYPIRVIASKKAP